MFVTDAGWWQSLAHALDMSLRRYGVLYKHLVQLSTGMTADEIITELNKLRKVPCRGKQKKI